MWYCSQCGQKNEGRFCINCGAEHVEPASYAFEQEAPAECGRVQVTSGKTDNGAKKKKALIIGVVATAIVVVLLGVILGIAVFGGGDDNDAVESTGVYYYVSADEGRAALYEDHNVESTVLVYLQNGSPVEYLDEENSVFALVLDHGSGMQGYMRNDELVRSLDEVAEEKTDPKAEDLETVEKTKLGDYYVTDLETYLSLRESPSEQADLLAKLYNGYKLALLERTSGSYWYVYDYNSGRFGYVSPNYLTNDESKVKNGETEVYVTPKSTQIIADYYVTGTKNYLAIRSVPNGSASSEIGKSYNGRTVGVIEKTNNTFWYVYDYSSGLYGYVKCAYLTPNAPQITPPVEPQPSSSLDEDEYIVKGTKNYLGIRTEPSSSDEAEIGRSYNGNVVQVLEKTNDTYWYIYDYSSGVEGYVKCAYLSK